VRPATHESGPAPPLAPVGPAVTFHATLPDASNTLRPKAISGSPALSKLAMEGEPLLPPPLYGCETHSGVPVAPATAMRVLDSLGTITSGIPSPVMSPMAGVEPGSVR